MRKLSRVGGTISPIRAARVAHGWTLEDLAGMTGLAPGHLSKVERARVGVSVEALFRIAKVLGLRELTKALQPHLREGSL